MFGPIKTCKTMCALVNLWRWEVEVDGIQTGMWRIKVRHILHLSHLSPHLCKDRSEQSLKKMGDRGAQSIHIFAEI